MECPACTTTKPMKSETITHKYKECGLDNITLVGVKRYKCEDCGEEYFGYGDINQLHGLIAQILIKKSDLLSGSECRFLRTRLGYSGDMLAKLMGYSKDHIYKIEKGSIPNTPAFDHYLRFMYANKEPNHYYDLHDLFLNGSGGSTTDTVKLRSTPKGWKVAKAA